MTLPPREPRPRVLCRVLPHGEGLAPPTCATEHSVGLDLAAAVAEDVVMSPGSRHLIPTGLALALPEGYEGQVRPRSGLAIRHGIIIPNSPGTIDPDYRGEVMVILMNQGQEPFVVRRGMRIAQLVVAPAVRPFLEMVDALPDTGRGGGGFGHSGD